MQNVLSHTSLDPAQINVHQYFNVVIAYEDFETGKHAKRIYDYLFAHLDHECEFRSQMWKFDVLAVSKLREMAAKDAAEADVLIISTHDTSDLPSDVKTWVNLWLKSGTRAIALVALFDATDRCLDHPANEFLANAARQAKLEFFSHPPLPGLVGEMERGEDANPGLQTRTYTVLADVVEEDGSKLHWGINE